MLQFGSLELPPKRLHTHGDFFNASSESYADIMHSQLNALLPSLKQIRKQPLLCYAPI